MSFVGRNNAKITNRPSGGGSKLQGLAPVTNKRAFIINVIQIKALGTKRNVVFCLNQLGGIGREKSQSRTNADGVSATCKSTN